MKNEEERSSLTTPHSPVTTSSWPTYRHDGRRSGGVATEVPVELVPQWSVELGGRLTQPVVADGVVYVVSKDTHTLHALDRKDGKILNAGLSKALRQPTRMLRLLPIMAKHFRHFDADLKKFRLNDNYKFGMHLKNFNQGTSILLDTPFICKFNEDPAYVGDVDALEDWEDYESLTQYAEQQRMTFHC